MNSMDAERRARVLAVRIRRVSPGSAGLKSGGFEAPGFGHGVVGEAARSLGYAVGRRPVSGRLFAAVRSP
jgi:hypothetical protein